MLTDLHRQRALIWAFANRDFSTRYRSSVLGWAWSLIQPLATLIVFAAVFSTSSASRRRRSGNGERASYAAFLFTGLVTWNAFASLLDPVDDAVEVERRTARRRCSSRRGSPILGASIVQMVQVLLELAVLIAMFLFLRNVGWTWLLAIPILLGMMFFAQGIGLVLSIVNARFGDVMYIVTVVLGALYFVTPVLYPISMVQGRTSGSA